MGCACNEWFPENARRVGRPAYTWDSVIQHFCRHKNWKLARTCPEQFFLDEPNRWFFWWTWNVNLISDVAQYFATLPGHPWIKRILAWQPARHKRVGRPKYCWDTMLTNFCRLKGLASWEVTARDADFRNSLLPEFPAIYPTLCDLYIRSSDYVCSFYPCLKQAAQCGMMWHAGLTLTLCLPAPWKGCLLSHAGVTHSLFCFCPRGASFGPASAVSDFDSLSGYLDDLAGCVTQATVITQPPHPCTWLVVNKLA